MKNLMLAIATCLISISVFANRVNSKSSIELVTVYPVGAMIERSAVTNLTEGQQFVVLKDLTHAIDPNTIQVGGKGDFEILSVKLETVYPFSEIKPKGMQQIEDSMKIVQDLMYLIDAEKQALNEEHDLIMKNKVISGQNSGVTAEQLDAMAKYYRSQLNEISKKQLDLSNQRKKQNEVYANLESRFSNMNSARYIQKGQIVVEVDAMRAEKVEFEFSYFTHLAGWKPKYNVRAESDVDEIQVDYHADVHQNTGLDWESIDVILSTSRPTFNNQKPTLHPWYLDFQNYRKSKQLQSVSYGYESEPTTESRDDMEKDKASNYYYENGDYKKLQISSNASKGGATALVNALNTSYKIDRKYTILSNNSTKQLFIKEINIPAMFNFYSVPSMQKEVFLTASVADWAGYDLVPGRATLFYNKTYVGNSYINSNVTDDTLQISLGKDQGIVINHEKVKDLCSEKKIGNNKRKTYVYEISVKNTNQKVVSVVVQDRVPVSKRSEIVVTIKDIAGAEYDEKTGFLKWTKELKPGESINFQFSYEIKYPKDAKVNLQG